MKCIHVLKNGKMIFSCSIDNFDFEGAFIQKALGSVLLETTYIKYTICALLCNFYCAVYSV